MWHALQAKHAHNYFQSVVCCQDLTSKLLVIPNYLLRGHQVAVNMTWVLFHG